MTSNRCRLWAADIFGDKGDTGGGGDGPCWDTPRAVSTVSLWGDLAEAGLLGHRPSRKQFRGEPALGLVELALVWRAARQGVVAPPSPARVDHQRGPRDLPPNGDDAAQQGPLGRRSCVGGTFVLTGVSAGLPRWG